MTEVYDPFKGQTIIIREGMVKTNMNPPPTTERPPAPKSQVAPSFRHQEQKSKEHEASSQE